MSWVEAVGMLAALLAICAGSTTDRVLAATYVFGALFCVTLLVYIERGVL